MTLTQRSTGLRFRLLALLGVFLCGGLRAVAAESIEVVVAGRLHSLTEVTSEARPYLRAMRFNAAQRVWNVDLSVTNTSGGSLAGPLVVLVESFGGITDVLEKDGVLEGSRARPYFVVATGALAPEQGTPARTLSLGYRPEAPRMELRVFAAIGTEPHPLAVVRTLDAVGQPLPGIRVTETWNGTSRDLVTDARFGIATLGGREGDYRWRFESEGYLPVWRSAMLREGGVTVVTAPRLVPRPSEFAVVGTAGGVVSNSAAGLRVMVPAGAVADGTQIRLAPLTGQTLPAWLPRGWSPMQAFWLGATPAVTGGWTVDMRPWGTIGTDERAWLVRWDPAQFGWVVTASIAGKGAAFLSAALPGEGAFALVLGDREPAAPPAPAVGEVLRGVESAPAAVDLAGLTATGTVTPAASPASRNAALVTASAMLSLNHSNALSSGLQVRGDVTERYELVGGGVRVSPRFDEPIVGYQRPGNGSAKTLQAVFPLRPTLLFGAEELSRATVTVDVVAPGTFRGSVVPAGGATLVDGEVRLEIGPRADGASSVVQFREVEAAELTGVTSGDLPIVSAFQVDAGELGTGRPVRLGLRRPDLPTGTGLVLARVLARDGFLALEPVERLRLQNGAVVSVEPAMGPRLPGIDGAGLFVVLRTPAPLGLVTGIVRGTGGLPLPGAPVRVAGKPWGTRTDASGRYQLVSTVGGAEVVMFGATSGEETGRAGFHLADAGTPVEAGISASAGGPRVIETSPVAGASEVPVVSAVTVGFNRAMNPASLLGSAIRLQTSSGQVVTSALSLNLRGTVATLLPQAPLEPRTSYRLLLASEIQDLAGRALDGPREFSFTTGGETVVRDAAAQLISYEPTNGVVRLRGTQGFAEPRQAVLLVNETTGRSTTVLAGDDGGFEGTLAATESDELMAVTVNANGTRTQVPVSQQIFRDGSVALFDAGGTIEVPGENGPIQLLVEPGSLNGRTRFRIESVPLAQAMNLVSNTQPTGGRVLGAFKWGAILGNPLRESVDISFPVKVEDMQLPAGVSPTNCTFGLAIARVIDDAPVYELVDRMHFEDGRLVTHSPPFFGLLGLFEDVFAMPLLMAVNQIDLIVHGKVFAAQVDTTTRTVVRGTEAPLAGAIVRGNPANTSLQTRGLLRPGSVFTTSGRDGKYTILVPTSAADFDRVIGITARHPKYPGVFPLAGLPDLDPGTRVAIGNVLTPHDIVFPLGSEGQKAPPVLAVSHNPQFVQPREEIRLTVVATDNDSVPDLSMYLDSFVSLTPGVTVTRGDISLEEVERDEVGPRGVRRVYAVSSKKAADVMLKITATDRGFLDRSQNYGLRFGGVPDPVGEEPIPSADPHDKTGPFVVSTHPSRDATGHPLSEPIVLQFDEALDRRFLLDPQSIVITPAATLVRKQLSADQGTLTLQYLDLQPDTAYTLTLATYIRDLAGNVLDQDPTLPGQQAFSMTFRTAPFVAGNLPDVDAERGVAALVKGKYAFVLERGKPVTANGKLSVFDLSVPAAPVRVTEYRVQPFPRDMVFLPRYSIGYTNGLSTEPTRMADITNVMTLDMIAVVGGLLGQGQVQTMRLIDVTQPTEPWLVAVGSLANSGFDAVTRVRWSPPMLSYLEIGQPDRVNVVNLQEWIIGHLLAFNQKEYKQFDDFPFPGLDLNGDGDFVDAGEALPRPARHPVDFAGKTDTYVSTDTEQPILDIAEEEGGEFIGALLGAGWRLDEHNQRVEEIPASFRTLYAAGLELSYSNANFSLPGGRPRALSTLFHFPLLRSNAVERLDLALATVQPEDLAKDNRLVVIDVTDRTAPKGLAEVPLPRTRGNTNVWGFGSREDGLILVASDTNSFLIDPTRFGMTATNGGPHPALLGIVPGVGGMSRGIASTASGVNVSPRMPELGVAVQTAPTLSFVYFPTNRPFLASQLAALPEATIDERLGRAVEVGTLQPARYRGESNVVMSSITNLAPQVHYYVMVRAPGGGGRAIDLAMESLNWAGHPNAVRGLRFPPAHGFSTNTLGALGQLPGPDDAPIRTLKAWRVSDNPASPYFNLYLSRPFVTVYEDFSKADLAAVDAALERDVFWSGFQMRVSIDPSMSTNVVLGRFAGAVDASDRSYRPGVEALAYALPAEAIASPNPGPVTGAQTIPMALNAITPHNSELVINATDIALPGRRLSIDFRRNYSGQSLHVGPFGRGWDFNFNQRVVELRPDVVPDGAKLPQVMRGTEADSEIATARDLVFHTGGGRAIIYRDAGTNAPAEIAADPLVRQLRWHSDAVRFYLPPPGIFAPMFKFRDGRYVRLDTDGKQTWFSPRGRLLRIYDRYEKNSLEMVYNRRGDLIRIEDELRRPLDIGYYRVGTDPEFRAGVDEVSDGFNGLGRIARLKDYSGRDVRYYYTADGLLDRREGPLVETAAPGGFTGRQVTRYTYSGPEQGERSARSLVALTGQDAGGVPVLSIGAFGERGRDTAGGVKIGGQALTLTQTHENTARAMSEGGARTTVTTADTASASYAFDSHGRVTETVTSGPLAATVTNRTEYWPNGLLKAVVAPEGNRTEYFYDDAAPSLRSRGNLVRVVRTPGPRGGAVLESRGHFDPWYNLPEGERTDYNGNTGTITLFPDHRDTESITQAGVRETFTVNEFGQMESHTTPDGIVERTFYNADGFVSIRQVGDFQTHYSYAPWTGATSDPTRRGRPSQILDARGIPTDLVYDELDQLVSSTRAGGSVTQAYDEAGNLIRKTVDVDAGRTLVQTNGFNRLGFQTAMAFLDVEVAGGTTNLITTYEPDSQNRVKTIRYPNGERHEFTYDHAGRTAVHEVVGSHRKEFGYDLNGNLVSVRLGDAVERYRYDGHDRMIREDSANGTRTELALDGVGNVRTNRVIDAGGRLLRQTVFEYDELNRPRSTTRSRNAGESVTRTDYDAGARKVTVTDALGAVASTTFDTAGRPVVYESPNQRQQFGYDPNGNPTERRTTEGGVTYVETKGYNDRDQLVSITDNLGRSTSLGVGIDGRLLRSTDREGHATTNTYSLLGERLASRLPNGVHREVAHGMGRHKVSLTDAAGNTSAYEFDPNGRMTLRREADGKVSRFGDFDAFDQAKTNGLPRGIEVVNGFDFEGQLTNRVVRSAFGTRVEHYEYDGLRRYRRIEDPSGSVEFEYDLGGFVRETRHNYTFTTPPAASALPFTVAQDADAADFRRSLTYPANGYRLTYGRDETGRLVALTPETGEPVIQSTDWVGDVRVGARVLGNNRVRLELAYDGERRVAARRYTRPADGRVLVDIRHAFDANGALVGRQFLHRGGRAEFFQHDAGYRLIRADVGVRPSISGALVRSVDGFVAPAGFGDEWAAGAYARVASYLPVDVVSSIQTLNPDGLVLPPVAGIFGAPDALLFVAQVDGFTRERDEVGNVTKSRLAVRIPGVAAPEWVEAALVYNDLGQLIRVERVDGVKVESEYNSFGLRIRRRVTGPAARCVPSDTAYLYDGPKLIEERDLANGMRLVRRYQYGDDSDELLGGDLDVAGTLVRHYFLTDHQRSVLAVADAQGEVVERVAYDPWGQPIIEGRDDRAPALSSVVRDAQGLRVRFSEPVLPVAQPVAAGTNWLKAYPPLGGTLIVEAGGAAVPGRVEWIESGVSPGGFGSELRFVPESALSGAGTVRLTAGRFQDEWGNENAGAAVSVDLGAGPGTTLFTGVGAGSTAAPVLGRSGLDSPFLFHGQVFDYETGLVYCRMRYYDPTTGQFISRDPAGAEDSVNLYAGFKNNPVVNRDMSGASIDELGRELEETGNRFNYHDSTLTDYILGRATAFVGRTLQLGTKAAEGWELMESNRPGTLGLMDRMKGAELFIGDAQQAFASFGAGMSAVGAVSAIRGVAGKAAGFFEQMAERRSMNAANRKFLHAQGLAQFEIDGFLNGIERFKREMKAESVEVAIRSFKKDKRVARREAVEAGRVQKPTRFGDKTDKNATLTDYILERDNAGKRHIKELTVTGDTDMFYVKVNGRTLNEAEVQQFRRIVNQEQARAYHRRGGIDVPNVSVLHGAHVNLPELYGTKIHGKTVNDAYLRKIGSPGTEAFAIRSGPGGRVTTFEPGAGSLKEMLLETRQKFWNTRGLHLPDNWFDGFQDAR